MHLNGRLIGSAPAGSGRACYARLAVTIPEILTSGHLYFVHLQLVVDVAHPNAAGLISGIKVGDSEEAAFESPRRFGAAYENRHF
ncbi:hypothetical protein ACLOJK_005848 [Asimina triloba]